MKIVKKCLGELRYLQSLKKKKRDVYIKNASDTILECLKQVALNELYAKYNKLPVGPKEIKILKPYKKTLLKLIQAKTEEEKRKHLLRGGVVTAILTVLGSIIATLAAAI